MDFRRHVIRDPQICGGVPVMKGTRVPLRTVLASLAEGDSAERLLEAFPSLTMEHIAAAIAYAAGIAEEQEPADVPVLSH
jgi:uncharacterized protein (DUF433 family)